MRTPPHNSPMWTAIVSVPLLTLMTGIGFPFALAVLARPLFPSQADGSLVSEGEEVRGSALVGQSFSGSGYFQPRPSVAGSGYDAMASGATNLGPTNPKLRDDLRQRLEEYRRRNELSPDTVVPMDAVTCSGSGLDPHISPANAALQIRRVARARGLDADIVRRLVVENTGGRQFGFLGEPRVSVFALNRALDRITPLPSPVSGR